MPAPSVKAQIRIAGLSVPVGLVFLVGGGAAVALGERAAGGILMALAVAIVVSGCLLMIRARSNALAALRAVQARAAREQAARKQGRRPPAP